MSRRRRALRRTRHTNEWGGAYLRIMAHVAAMPHLTAQKFWLRPVCLLPGRPSCRITASSTLESIDDRSRPTPDPNPRPRTNCRRRRRSTRAEKSSSRRRSDLQRLKQELQALKQRLDRTSNSVEANPPTQVSPETIDRKLDSALVDSFPGSDAVSFLEPTPGKPSGTS